MPVWQVTAESLVDGITQASVFNGNILNHQWDGRDRNGSRLPYGDYTMRFEITDWDPGSHVTDTNLTLGAAEFTDDSSTSHHACTGLTYTYTP